MKVKYFDYSFFVVLFSLTLAMLYGGACYFNAIGLNEQSLRSMFRLHLILSISSLVLILIYAIINHLDSLEKRVQSLEGGGRRKMKLKYFDYSFFVVLFILALVMLYGGTCYLNAIRIISDNQKYEYITREQERQFNEWDLKSISKLHFIFGILFFLLILAYILTSYSNTLIKPKKRIKRKTKAK